MDSDLAQQAALLPWVSDGVDPLETGLLEGFANMATAVPDLDRANNDLPLGNGRGHTG